MTADNWYKDMADALARRDRALAQIMNWKTKLTLALNDIEAIRVTKLVDEPDGTNEGVTDEPAGV
jgi:5'(3')-deoxyribonucleotidase